MGVVVGFAFANGVARAQEILAEIDGPLADSSFGRITATGGDFDGDGVSELLIYGANVDSSGNRGYEVFVYSGATLGPLRSHFQVQGTEYFGWPMAILGDVDGDATADYMIESYSSSTRTGHIYSGASGAWLRSDTLPVYINRSARSMVATGDLDADGLADYAVLEVTSGTALCIAKSGATGASIWYWTRTDPFDELSSVADFDGDGARDLALTDPINDAVQVFSGRDGTLLNTVVGTSGELFGWSFTSTGDLDGDGVDDFAVSAPYGDGDSAGSGAIYVYSGATHLHLDTLNGDGEANDLTFAWHLRNAGDVDGDGTEDVISVTADENDVGGRALVFSGRSGERIDRFEPGFTLWWGRLPGPIGDLDGDGLAELVLPDDQYSHGSGRGRVRIVRGNDLWLLATPPRPRAGDVVSLETREGPSSQLVLTAIVRVDGVPTFLPLGGIGTFDTTGGWIVSGTTPPGLSGTTLLLKSWAQKSPRGMRESWREWIGFQ